MKITLLGTGDAIGTPKVGCNCPQCSHASKTGAMRLRTSLLVENEGKHILIDSSPDLRQQLLLHGSPHIDAVIWTHGHYDHFIGFGEFYRVQKIPPVFAAPRSSITALKSSGFSRLIKERSSPMSHLKFSA